MTADADNAGRSDPNSAPIDAEDYPETAAGTSHGAGDAETELVPPATAAAPDLAWSSEAKTEEIGRQSWRLTSGYAAMLLACTGVLALGIGVAVWALVHMHDAPRRPPSPPVSTPTSSAPTTSPAAAPPTVTVTPAPPVTVTAQAAPPPPAASGTDVFTTFPDGHEGVVGGHTSCAFAANVRQMFYVTGMSSNFTAFSPITGDEYQMTCVGKYRAYFTDGSTMISTRCYGGDNAEVVIW
jgi:hypothetical protein